MPILRLYFLGPLVTRCDERQLPVPPTLKSQSLLAYLVLHRDQPQFRDRLATLLWGDRPELEVFPDLARHWRCWKEGASTSFTCEAGDFALNGRPCYTET